MTTIPGGWSGFGPVTPESQAVFEQAVKPLLGVHYAPLLVATQVVAGLRYAFIASGKVVAPEGAEFAALVYVYQPVEGPVHLTEIKRITP